MSIYIIFYREPQVYSFGSAIIATHVRTQYAHANKQAGREEVEEKEGKE